MQEDIIPRKKITISKIVSEMIKTDLHLFNIKFNNLINRIILSLKNSDLEKILIQHIYVGEEKMFRKEIGNDSFNYTLTSDTIDFLRIYMNENNINNSELGLFIKNIIENFYRLTRSEREKILYFDIYNKIKYLQESKKNKVKIVFIDYNKKINRKIEKTIDVNPLALKVGLNENRNYFIYKVKEKDIFKYHKIKISAILDVKISDKIKEERFLSKEDKEKLEDFDGFTLEKSEEIEVKFTNYGMHLFNDVIHIDKPTKSRNKSKMANHINFTCKRFLAKRYFSKFYEDATIIAPPEFNNEIRESVKKMAENYNFTVFDNKNIEANIEQNIEKIKKICNKIGLEINIKEEK